MEEKYISLKEAAEISGYAPDYIGQLIRSGKISGKQVYTNVSWVTTEKAVLGYKNKLTLPGLKRGNLGFIFSNFANRARLEINVFKQLFASFKLFLPSFSIFIVSLFIFLLLLFSYLAGRETAKISSPDTEKINNSISF